MVSGSGVSDQFRHKPGCTCAEDGERLKSLVCSEKKALIGRSAPLLSGFPNDAARFIS